MGVSSLDDMYKAFVAALGGEAKFTATRKRWHIAEK
jgi:hypothetical protein